MIKFGDDEHEADVVEGAAEESVDVSTAAEASDAVVAAVLALCGILKLLALKLLMLPKPKLSASTD